MHFTSVQLANGIGALAITRAGAREKRHLAGGVSAGAVVAFTSESSTEEIKEAAVRPVQVTLKMTAGATFRAIVAALAPAQPTAVDGYACSQPTDMSTKMLLEQSPTITVSGPAAVAIERPGCPPTSMKALFGARASGLLAPGP
ncbi:hypothetical protein OG478_13455 [Streptomyces phaeochromogenes]|uniref:hypothetical protein n=1 Tax=Streptomyces phaeochromogenes TaxID=1923 RepID=UPI0038649822|nr:hypothetical protein OG478_13455 [Streptomyces phaeochromogenes]